MTWNEQVTNLSSKVNKRLGLLKRIRHLLPHNARLLSYNCLVLPLFDYGDLVWGDKDNSLNWFLYFGCSVRNQAV